MSSETRRLRAFQQQRAAHACGVEGCKLPWREHFTKVGTQRKALKDHFPADFQAAMESARLFARKAKKKEAKGAAQ